MIKQGDILKDAYEIREKLGSGGGGIVYKAFHTRLKTDIVVKQIKTSFKGISDRAEADLLKKLRHTYLPGVYDFLEIDGDIYTVMDFIPGRNLQEELKSHGPFDQKTVLEWGRQLAEALDYLHSMKPPVIHSDIKPANIMLRPDGKICLIDFNVSLAFDSTKRTSAGVTKGFSPPEQYPDSAAFERMTGLSDHAAHGRPEQEETSPLFDGQDQDSGNTETLLMTESMEEAPKGSSGNIPEEVAAVIGRGVDTRSDIYSLGATLYYLLTGHVPSAQCWKNKPVDECGIRIGKGFAHIIRKMMESSPDRRYKNGHELKHAFDHIREIDDNYVKFKRKTASQRIGLIAMAGLSVCLIAGGYFLRKQETAAAYGAAVTRAGELLREGDYDGAMGQIKTAMALMPEKIDAYEIEVQRLYLAGAYEECIRYGTGIVNNPQYTVQTEADRSALANILYLVGNAYFEVSDNKNAINCFELSLEYDPANSACYRDLALALAAEGNSQRAEEYLQKAVEYGLAEDSIYMAEGELAYARQEYLQAIEKFDQVLAVSQDNDVLFRTVLMTADAYRRLGEEYLPREIEILSRYETMFGVRSVQLTERLAEALARQGDHSAAIGKFQNLISRGYESYQMYENLAILYEENDQFEDAETLLLKMEDMYPNRYETYKRLAYLEADLQSQKANEARNYWKMREYYEKAAELYEKQSAEDAEMYNLKQIINDLEKGGWFNS